MIQPMWARNWAAASILPSVAAESESGAHFFDGETPVKHPVDVTFGADALTVHRQDGAAPVVCPYDLTIRIQAFLPREHVALRPNSTSGARLVLVDPALIEQLRRHAPRVVDPPFLRRSRVRRWTAIVATLVAAMVAIFVIIPAASSVFAYLIPDSTKRALGASTVSQLFGQTGLCEGESGAGALSRLSYQLAATMDLRGDIEIHVTKFPMVNAFALPGRHMVLTEKLIEKSETSAELAAVMAHELGHMKLDHPTEAYFRRGLISAMVDALFGGGFGGEGIESVAVMAITFSYSREAEAEADTLGIDALNALGITSQGMADFFGRQAKSPGPLGKTIGKLDWLSTHPGDEGRRRNALERGTGENQALTEKEWRAVSAICG